jgi:hypothetical protein
LRGRRLACHPQGHRRISDWGAAHKNLSVKRCGDTGRCQQQAERCECQFSGEFADDQPKRRQKSANIKREPCAIWWNSLRFASGYVWPHECSEAEEQSQFHLELPIGLKRSRRAVQITMTTRSFSATARTLSTANSEAANQPLGRRAPS